MDIDIRLGGNQAVIALSGRFDFSTHSEFSGCYAQAVANPAVSELAVDLRQVEYLDSSALGMLLLLSERAKFANKSVALVNPNPMVAQVLARVSFGRIFTLR